MTRKKRRAAARPETRQERYKRTHPWVRLVEWARRRCSDTSSKWWTFYGSKGITCDLTAADLKEIWLRDSAHLLKRPSLDRVVGGGNYTRDNVRIIEFNCNARMAWDESFKFLFDGGDPREAEAGGPEACDI